MGFHSYRINATFWKWNQLHLFSAIRQVISVKHAGHRATLQAVWCSVKSSELFFSHAPYLHKWAENNVDLWESAIPLYISVTEELVSDLNQRASLVTWQKKVCEKALVFYRVSSTLTHLILYTTFFIVKHNMCHCIQENIKLLSN